MTSGLCAAGELGHMRRIAGSLACPGFSRYRLPPTERDEHAAKGAGTVFYDGEGGLEPERRAA